MLNNLKYKLSIFMQNRYGPDDLYKACLIFYVILLVLNVFVSSSVISLVMTLIVIWTFFRFFSKNIAKRQAENTKYLIAKNKISSFFNIQKKRIKDKEHVYKKCPHCKAMLRFPKKKGEHDAICPRCHKEMKIKIN